MTQERISLGRWGEEVAESYLRKKGYKILERNYRTPVGEIDLIARDSRDLVFVEVKTRRSNLFGAPQDAVGAAKQRQILRTAQWYLSSRKDDALNPRFDVVAVTQQGGDAIVDHFIDAFHIG